MYHENGPKVEGANLLLSYFFRSKLQNCDCKFRALLLSLAFLSIIN